MTRNHVSEIAFLVAATLLTLLAMEITDPALNIGDFYRVLELMFLYLPDMAVPGDCMAYTEMDQVPGPKPALALFGALVAGLDRAFGSQCLSIDLWFLSLSAVYWLGSFFAIRGARGVNLLLRCLLLLIVFFVFSGFLKSFFEETFLIALVPWIALLAGQKSPSLWLFAPVVFLALISKSQAVLFAPVFSYIAARMYLASRSVVRTSLAVSVVALGCGYTLWYSYSIGNNVFNSYNRIYNGIGWARLDVGNWPTVGYGEREFYFAQNQDAFMADTESMCAPGNLNLMGTSFWPTAFELQRNPVVITGDYDTAMFLDELGFDEFFSCFAQELSPTDFLRSIYQVFLKSDYRLETIILHSADGLMLGYADELRQWLLRYLSILLAAASVLIVMVYRDIGPSSVTAYLLLASPVFVVLGDGFFEFERHMIINFAFLSSAFFLFFTEDTRAD